MVADIIIVSKEKVRVVATFSELHHQVCQGGLANLTRIVGKLYSRLFRYVLVDQFLPS